MLLVSREPVSGVHTHKRFNLFHSERRWGGGSLQYQMDTGVKLTLPKDGAFGQNTVSKKEGSLGEKPIFG